MSGGARFKCRFLANLLATGSQGSVWHHSKCISGSAQLGTESQIPSATRVSLCLFSVSLHMLCLLPQGCNMVAAPGTNLIQSCLRLHLFSLSWSPLPPDSFMVLFLTSCRNLLRCHLLGMDLKTTTSPSPEYLELPFSLLCFIFPDYTYLHYVCTIYVQYVFLSLHPRMQALCGWGYLPFCSLLHLQHLEQYLECMGNGC